MNPPAPDPPLDRYGRPSQRGRLALTAAVVVVASAFGAWLLWAALGATTSEVRGELLGYDVLDDAHIEVRVQVVADRQDAVTCSVEAVDESREIVAATRVRVPPGTTDRRVVERVLPTRGPAVAAALNGCRVALD